MQYEIRSLELGGILDHTIKLFIDNLGFIAKIMCTIVLPITLMFGLVSAYFTPDIRSVDPITGPTLAQQQGALIGGAITIIGAITAMVLNCIASAAICYGIAWRYRNQPVTSGGAVRQACRQLFALIALAILNGLGVGLGFLACIIPGIYLMLAWYIIVPVLMFEGTGIGEVFGRSMSLMKGQKGQAFVLVFILTIINVVAGSVSALIPNMYAQAITLNVIQLFILSINSVAVTVFYFSARCKAENYDLEILTQELESEQAAAEPVF